MTQMQVNEVLDPDVIDSDSRYRQSQLNYS